MDMELLRRRLALIDGALRWADGPRTGRLAGTERGRGYQSFRLAGAQIYVHRAVYALHHGVDPGDKVVDHLDGDPTNNRPENLKLATNAENVMRRVRLNKNNTSGARGVYWSKAAQKWVASIRINGVTKYLGVFTCKDAAAAAHRNELENL